MRSRRIPHHRYLTRLIQLFQIGLIIGNHSLREIPVVLHLLKEFHAFQGFGIIKGPAVSFSIHPACAVGKQHINHGVTAVLIESTE